MGPKYSINKPFSGQKRGPDPLKNFDEFKLNVISNLNKVEFKKPICEVLLNQKYFNGVGAYLNSEIMGRLDIDPFMNFNELTKSELDKLFNMIFTCCNESYNLGGGELKDWKNPFEFNNIHTWIKFYGNKDICQKQKFGTRNIWIKKKFIKNN
jgi:endonuclease VIII-like 1